MENQINIYLGIFFPDLIKWYPDKLINSKFAYYTNAETAMKIIGNREIWLRNATVMNDFSEISYGNSLLEKTMSSPVGKDFITSLELVFPGIKTEVCSLLNEGIHKLKDNIYLSCLSIHDNSENQTGRLSMWRAYGDVALIINSTPFSVETSKLGVFSTPVQYLNQSDLEKRIYKMTKDINNNTDLIRGMGKDYLVNILEQMLIQTVIGTKHPGFREENEWRVYFNQTNRRHPVLTRKVESIGGVSQVIWALPLRDDPANGLYKADIPSLFFRMIIGPTQFPNVIATAFKVLLEDAGVKDISGKIVVSDIPLRKHV